MTSFSDFEIKCEHLFIPQGVSTPPAGLTNASGKLLMQGLVKVMEEKNRSASQMYNSRKQSVT